MAVQKCTLQASVTSQEQTFSAPHCANDSLAPSRFPGCRNSYHSGRPLTVWELSEAGLRNAFQNTKDQGRR
jgi:hypothetical protein